MIIVFFKSKIELVLFFMVFIVYVNNDGCKLYDYWRIREGKMKNKVMIRFFFIFIR